jgi:non-specific serine/threonine protein kinase
MSMVTDFVGREAELLHLATLFSQARLVTVHGPGGVGKTRVSLRAAAEAVDSYPDGVWIVELSGLRDPELLPNTVAARLGLPEQDARPQVEAVLDHLRERRLLLILDTCEHLIDACAHLAEAIMREAPEVTLLATSRQPLDVRGEHTFPVGPLPEADAVELFARRAAAAVPGFTVGEDNRREVAWLCQRLDGIPLAIELAAVQLRALPLPELVRRLDTLFAMLAAGASGALPRHQTLRTAIEWSYELCSPLERALWQRLSVFADGFDLAAAEEVCAESDPEREEIISALIGLIDKSVVLREPTGGARYRLLDTIREFGGEQLAAAGAEARWRGRHIGRYLRMAGYFAEHFADDEQMARFHELRDEHANLRAALEYALDVPASADADPGAGPQAGPGGQRDSGRQLDLATGRELQGARLATALAGYWMISGMVREGGYWLGKLLARFAPPSRERASVLASAGFLASWAGDVDGSIAECLEAIAIATELGEPDIAARGYLHMNLALTFRGEHEKSAAAGLEAQRRLTEAGDRVGLLMLACQIGHLHQLTGHPDEAVATCAAGLALLGEDSQERWLQSYLYLVSSFALFQQPGKDAECTSYASRALFLKSELGDTAGIAYALDTLGWLAIRLGRAERVAWLFGAADALWERVGSRFGGTALMEQVRQGVEAAARAAVGADRYAELWRDGAARPLEEIVRAALANDDALAA